ncbi:hypothetical protein [Streptomyces olivaceoviridis]|uniref:hypothetical protein n=1 Tax=Streptomyces olivaceoviridis TaxID=1921 RepID=UPI0037BC1A61
MMRLMRVYGADLLDGFETAVEARVNWVSEHRDKIDLAIEQGIGASALDLMIQETAATASQLDTVRENLKRLIQERYPMGSPDGQTG